MSEYREVGLVAQMIPAYPGFDTVALLHPPGSGYHSAPVIGWIVELGGSYATPVTVEGPSDLPVKLPSGRVFDAKHGATYHSIEAWLEYETARESARRTA